ncbi:DUF4926 domain-containing protein [Chroococcus sp. FPU101]|uniref:DUF4926 domain-containing protein n=1 Tax=Chroococcus sp. FPU101 TaxID=1974212 RepID=UPI001A909530|nr:DUF4926 domain-containing protein [Chroococcus sp. FPU101]GFE70849.1 hypothetical protein CFPU101_34590 [Chroococcus sp. FPU101]
MKQAELFQWVELKQDVPDSVVKKGDRGVIVDHLQPTKKQKEAGYTIEVFKNGETLDVVSVPISWIMPLSKFWESPNSDHKAFLNGYNPMDEGLYDDYPVG